MTIEMREAFGQMLVELGHDAYVPEWSGAPAALGGGQEGPHGGEEQGGTIAS